VKAETISKVMVLMCADQQVTISDVVNEVGISNGSAQAILTELQIKWDETRWILHHDNAPSRTAMAVQQFLAGKQIALMLQPLIRQTSHPMTFGSSLK
jgi:hypothetical protein